MKRESVKRAAIVLAWFLVLGAAGLFWLELHFARMAIDMNMYHLGRASKEMAEQGQALAKCELFGVAAKPVTPEERKRFQP